MNILLQVTLFLCLIVSIIETIIIYIYDNEFEKAKTTKDIDYQVFTKKFYRLKEILGNAINILIVIGLVYSFVYLSIAFFMKTKFYDKHLNINVAVQSENEFSGLMLEIFFGVLVKILSDALKIYFINMSLEEITLIKVKGGFIELNM